MQTDMMALALPIVLYLVTSLIGYKIIMREKRAILASIDVKIQEAVDGVGEAIGVVLEQIFEKPVVKASMTNLGKLGGAAMQDKAIMNKMATDVLDGPKFAALKMAAKASLNIDIDQYIEEHGAVQTLGSAKELGGMLGIDIMQVLAGGLNGANLAVGSEANGINYYLRR